jgi:hypothetical protein
MAQLDKFTFVDQSLLVLFTFLIMYIFHSRVLLPFIAKSLKTKTKLLNFILLDVSKYKDISNSVYSNNVQIFFFLITNLNSKLNLLINYINYSFKNKKI